MGTTWIIIIGVIAAAILLAFLLAVANFSGDRFLEKYKEFDKVEAYCELTLLEYFEYLNHKYFDNKIAIVQISNLAGDAYSKGKLFLSGNTLSTQSLASYTIVSHELGHALQDKEGNKLKMLSRLRKTVRLLGYLFLPSIIAGGVLSIIGQNLLIPGIALLAFAVLIFMSSLLIKLITISIEKDASKKGLGFLKEVLRDEGQVKQCKRFLNDAKLTYWGDFLRVILGWTGLSRKTKLFN